jgi:DNA repair protein RecO (recombination protein O)
LHGGAFPSRAAPAFFDGVTMAYLTTQGIVLRRSDYRDNDRVLTLLTPARGRVDVTARGCRKPKSPLLAASELFAMGEYVLYRGRGHEMVTACELQDSFYPLRNDITLLSHGALLLQAAETVAQKEEPAGHLYLLLARSLARLSYGVQDPRAVTAAFLLHLMGLAGYKPVLNACAKCGQVPSNGGVRLVPERGEIVCTRCGGTGPVFDAEGLTWLKEVQSRGIDKAQAPPAVEALPALIAYAEHFLERRLPELIEAPLEI